MILKFPEKRITPRTDLYHILTALGFSPVIHRVIVDLDFLDDNQNILISTQALFDTGAPVSLFPVTFLEDIPQDQQLPHTIFGIINSPECRVEATFGKALIQLRGADGTISPSFSIPIAFIHNVELPYLLGMKNLLDNNRISMMFEGEVFIIKFKD